MQHEFSTGSKATWRAMRQATRAVFRSLVMTAGAVALFISASPVRGATAQNTSFNDPLTTAATKSGLPARGSMVGIAEAGSHLVAVGRRGLILMSADHGKHWEQVASPVTADLTAIRFSDATHGWIVGQDAVVLKTTDGGASWTRSIDGRAILALIVKTYSVRSEAGDAVAAGVIRDAKRSAAESATPGVYSDPLLDVWFANANDGFVVGAFGLILHTTDGGVTWTPWIDRTENDGMNHIYAVDGVDGQVYIAGEQGFLRRLDPAGDHFVKMPTPYQGSYFGLYVQKNLLIAYGLRGNAYVSNDQGMQWNKVETGLSNNIIAAFPSGQQDLLFISQAGEMLSTNAVGGAARALDVKHAGEIYGAIAADGGVVTTGLGGVNFVSLPAPTQ